MVISDREIRKQSTQQIRYSISNISNDVRINRPIEKQSCAHLHYDFVANDVYVNNAKALIIRFKCTSILLTQHECVCVHVIRRENCTLLVFTSHSNASENGSIVETIINIEMAMSTLQWIKINSNE